MKEVEVLIKPSPKWVGLRLRELWRYRELLLFLTWRDIKVRYKQTVLGAAWAIIQPFLAMVVFSLFFGKLLGVSSGELPYPIFNYSALVPWTYFANSLTTATNSMVTHRGIITKIYFPRLILPFSSVLPGLIDFAIAFVFLVGMMFFYGIVPTQAIWMLPLFVLLIIMTALGIGLWLSAMNAIYRDIRYIVPPLIQTWMFATPIVYSSNIIPEKWRLLYGLNPMAGVIEGFRWALLGKGGPPGPMLWISVGVVVILLIGGLFYFRRMEKTFQDVI
jgi:lipopolysaccharide transport system permease protein